MTIHNGIPFLEKRRGAANDTIFERKMHPILDPHPPNAFNYVDES
jgi:hypothetical protein